MARRRSEEGKQAGRRIAELRERHHLTQEVAAQRLAVGHRTYQAWESGESVPRWHNRVKLGELYGVDPAAILGPPSPDPLALAGRVEEIESELIRQGHAIEALEQAVEEGASVRAETAAKTAQRRAPGKPGKADRRRRA